MVAISSSAATVSPTCLFHILRVPSLIDSAIWGTLTVSAATHNEQAEEQDELSTNRAGGETSENERVPHRWQRETKEDGGDSELEQRQISVWKALAVDKRGALCLVSLGPISEEKNCHDNIDDNMLNVAVIGVGLVGTELVSQILASTGPFSLFSLSSSTHTLFHPGTDWKSALAASPLTTDLDVLTTKLRELVAQNKRVAVVDNTLRLTTSLHSIPNGSRKASTS